jgi:threonine dehydratase
MERSKQIVEPAGATPLAAVLSGKINVEGKRVVCVMSGGNIDVSFIQSIIERGLVARHRRMKFKVKLLDKPGSLVQLLNIIADAGANVLAVEHDKLNYGLNPNETIVRISCEVGGKAHGEALIRELTEKGYRVKLQ